jgi:hypothetical protein
MLTCGANSIERKFATSALHVGLACQKSCQFALRHGLVFFAKMSQNVVVFLLPKHKVIAKSTFRWECGGFMLTTHSGTIM